MMVLRLRIWIAAVTLATIGVLHAQGDMVYVVTITDLDGTQSHEVMSRAELAALRDDISLESRNIQAALSAARKEWEGKEETKGERFPLARVVPRKYQQQGPYNEAQARGIVDRRTEREMEREFKGSSRGGKKPKLSARMQEKEDRREQRLTVKALQEEAAMAAFKKHLAEMVGKKD